MANEAVPVVGPYLTYDFTVASNTAIDKYTLCVYSGDRTAAASATTGAFAGVAMSDKSVTDSDASTILGLAQTGVFDLRAGGGTTITPGDLVIMSGVNIVEKWHHYNNILSGEIVGTAREGVSIGTAETIEVDIGRRG